MSIIKAGFLISYDYAYVKTSLPRVYDYVDAIYLAVDGQRKTWSGQNFVIGEEFWEWIKAFDRDNKITIYQDDFYQKGLTPIECDTRERNLLGEKMGDADWYLQIDSDEYFLDFSNFTDRLKQYKPDVPTTVACPVVTLFKQLTTGYLLIGDSSEHLNFATNNPVYDVARNNTSGNVCVYWDDVVLHQSWARTPDEIYWKLHNWGHRDDFNVLSFYNLWNAIDEDNYRALSNFHPLSSETWPKLIFVTGSITDILKSYELNPIYKPTTKPIRKPLLSRLWKEIKSSL